VAKKIMAPADNTVKQTDGGDQNNKTNGDHAHADSSKPKWEPGDLVVETKREVAPLAAPIAYVPKNNIIDIELSRTAAYAAIIAATGGLEPNPTSVFAKKHGFQLRIVLSESEEGSWNSLNT